MLTSSKASFALSLLALTTVLRRTTAATTTSVLGPGLVREASDERDPDWQHPAHESENSRKSGRAADQASYGSRQS